MRSVEVAIIFEPARHESGHSTQIDKLADDGTAAGGSGGETGSAKDGRYTEIN